MSASKSLVDDRVQVLTPSQPRPHLDIIEKDGVAEAVVWPGMGAQARSLHRILLDHGGRTVSLQHKSDAVYFVARGSATIVDELSGEDQSLVAGAMVHIDAGDVYRFVGLTATEIIGGACPPDPDLYRHLSIDGGTS